MIQHNKKPKNKLPSGYFIRPARITDTWEIYKLMYRVPFFLLLALALLPGLLLLRWIENPFWTLGLGLFALALAFPLVAFFCVPFLKPPISGLWVVERHKHLVAYAKLSSRNKCSVIDCLYVAPPHRRQGVGSCLVQHLAQEVTKPLFIFCIPRLVGFYTRLGFVSPTPTLFQAPQSDINVQTTSVPLVLP